MSICQVYARGYTEGFCYPKNIANIYQGGFFARSRISMRDYLESPEFNQIPRSTMIDPANQKIPTFWYKIVFNRKNPGNDNSRESLIRFWSSAFIQTPYIKQLSTKGLSPPTSTEMVFGEINLVDSKQPVNEWTFYLNLKTMEGNVSYNRKSMKVICNESYGTALKNFKFKPDDTFTLPVKLEYSAESDSVPLFPHDYLPKQGGYCLNEKEYPGLRLLWTYQNKSGHITVRQEFKSFLNFGGEKEKSFMITKYKENSKQLLTGFLKEIFFSHPEKPEISLKLIDNNFDTMMSNSHTYFEDDEELQARDLSPILKEKINKENLYGRVSIDAMRKFLKAQWLFTYNDKKFWVYCIPNIELPWGPTFGDMADSTLKGKGIMQDQVLEVDDSETISEEPLEIEPDPGLLYIIHTR
ncbi:MAG: hypothetical protein K0R14_500 [Burkholderiales bacterium]|jgi:hypothetical protein|nr:hypothetical protein [Burkholderiales bacterium]